MPEKHRQNHEDPLNNEIEIRPLVREDRPAILSLLYATNVFTEAEVDVALELIDVWLDKPEQKDYILLTAGLRGEAVGYVCFGPTPATESTFDLYWIAVAPALQGHGLGEKLLHAAEKDIAGRGGKMVIIETSSTEKYRPTRTFYERRGYVLEARIHDFYRSGDDRLIYVKKLAI